MDDRKLEVLRAIVTDYVSSQEPVGSNALVERHNLGVSPATVRNDMAALEEEGYITQPHTSAGRIPTDKGYRLFVDRLGSVKPLSPAEQRAIQTFLTGAVDLDDVLRRTVRLLAQVTQQVAIVQYPTLSQRRSATSSWSRCHPAAAGHPDQHHGPDRAACDRVRAVTDDELTGCGRAERRSRRPVSTQAAADSVSCCRELPAASRRSAGLHRDPAGHDQRRPVQPGGGRRNDQPDPVR